MPQPDYKDYNNYSQRDKESMRTAAADESVSQEKLLVTQTDEVESKLTAINTDTTAIKTDVGNIKTNVGLIKTAEQTIQSNMNGISQDLGTIINLLAQLLAASYKIEASPAELEISSSGTYDVDLSFSGEWGSHYRWYAQSYDFEVSISDQYFPQTRMVVNAYSAQSGTIDISIHDEDAMREVKRLSYKVVVPQVP